MTLSRPQNFAEAVRQLEVGVPSYVVMGDFLDEFYRSPLSEKQAFLDREPPASSALEKVMAVNYAATAEKLAHDFGLDVPAWVEKPQYFLKAGEAIYGYRSYAETRADLAEILREESPAEFARRNLFVSANALTRV